jgi:hypothetical protein
MSEILRHIMTAIVIMTMLFAFFMQVMFIPFKERCEEAGHKFARIGFSIQCTKK